jgi:hypothetical protein
MSLPDELGAYMKGFAQAVNHLAWDTEGTIMIVEPREAMERGYNAGEKAYEQAIASELIRLSVKSKIIEEG